MRAGDLLSHARHLAEANNHKLLPLCGDRSNGSACVICARQVQVVPDPGLNGAAIAEDAIAETALASQAEELLLGPSSFFEQIHNEQDSG